MTSSITPQKGLRWTRLLGIGLLVILLLSINTQQVIETLRHANPRLIIIALLANLPLILLKAIRWRIILLSQNIEYGLWPAYLAFWGSLFIGLLTPGRLGELIKSLHVTKDLDIPSSKAFSSVLADRLFDLGLLVLVGNAAVLNLGLDHTGLVVVVSLLLISLPLGILLHKNSFKVLLYLGQRTGKFGNKFFAENGWLSEMRQGFLKLTPITLLASTILTILAYGIFFGQCYLLSKSIDLSIDFVTLIFAIGLGSLVTLLPISISGLGTRDAAIITYLGTIDILREDALSLSLLVFVIFYLGNGLIGALAWWIKPIEITNNT